MATTTAKLEAAISTQPLVWQRKKFRERVSQVVATLLIIIGVVLILIPVGWMISTSLKSEFNVTSLPPQWIPTETVKVQVEVEGRKKGLFLYDVNVEGQERVLAAVKLNPEKSVFVDPDNPDQVYYAPAAAAKKHEVVNLHWENYVETWTYALTPFGTFMMNTLIYALVAVFGEVVICSLVAYGFARLRAPGKNILFLIVLGTLMVPPEVTIIPSYVLFTRYIPDILSGLSGTKVVWADTYWPLMLPKFFGSAFLIFLIRQFYMGIPRDYDDAARIDGAGFFQTWWRIIIPMSQPVLIAVAILSFQYHWARDYMTPLIYLNSTEKFPLTVGLANFSVAYGGTPYHLMMAGAIIAVLPLVLIFFVLNRYFIQGVVVSGIKG